MKKVIIATLLIVVSAMFASCEKDISVTDLPTQSQTFISTHFPDVAVVRVVKENEGLFGKNYTAFLANGFEIDFDKNGDWEEIDGHINPLPQSILNLLPAGIVKYVTETFPDFEIISVSKERKGFEVKISGYKYDLKFDKSGSFKGFDD